MSGQFFSDFNKTTKGFKKNGLHVTITSRKGKLHEMYASSPLQCGNCSISCFCDHTEGHI